MIGTVKNVTELDNDLIAASLQSENLLRAAELMPDKLHSIQRHQRDEISHTESLIAFRKE